MAIVTEIENSEALEKMLSNLSATNLHRAVARASGRAATAARTAGTKQLRAVYTMKAGDMKSRVSVRKESDGTTLLIRGSVERIEKFRTRVKRGKGGGVFASVKRGTSSKVPRSFEAHGHMFVGCTAQLCRRCLAIQRCLMRWMLAAVRSLIPDSIMRSVS